MIYIDANIFIYAFYRSDKRNLSPKTLWMKEQAKIIIKELSAIAPHPPKFCISIIQLSEITNLLKSTMTQLQLQELLLGLYSNPNLEIVEVSNSDCINAIDKMKEYDLDANDLCAYIVMKRRAITQIYSFDSGFEKIQDIERLPKIPSNFKNS